MKLNNKISKKDLRIRREEIMKSRGKVEKYVFSKEYNALILNPAFDAKYDEIKNGLYYDDRIGYYYDKQ